MKNCSHVNLICPISKYLAAPALFCCMIMREPNLHPHPLPVFFYGMALNKKDIGAMILKPISYESLVMSPSWNIYLSIHYPLHPLLLSNLRSIPLTPFQIYFPPILLLLHPCRYIIVGPNLRLLTRNL